jgi:hypothetical protein
LKRLIILLLAVALLVACEEDVEPTPTPIPPEATGVALNPPQVWIDRPLNGETIILGVTSPEIVAHASALSGNAILEVRDELGQILSTIDLGSAVDTLAVGGQLNRYEGDWLAAILPLLEQSDGILTLELTVYVSGVPSNPVMLTFMQPSPTPTGTSTLTPSPTTSETPTSTPTLTLTPTLTHTPTNTPTDTPTVTDTPSITPSPTVSPTWTPSLTPTLRPDVPFVPKDELPCRVTAVRGVRVPAMLAPFRDTVLFIEWPDEYDVTGKTLVGPTIWWQIFLPQTRNPAWVSDEEVLSTGSCLLVNDEEPPLPGPPPAQPPPPNEPPPPNVPAGQPVIYFFRTNTTQVSDQTCATLTWSVEFVDAVFLNNSGVVGNGSRNVCAQDFGFGDVRSLNFTLRIDKNGATVDSRTITLTWASRPVTAVPPTRVPPTSVPPTRVPPTPIIVRINSFTASDYYMDYGECETVYWSVSNADQVTLTVAGSTSSVGLSGSRSLCWASFSGSSISLTLRAYRNGVLHDSRGFTIDRYNIIVE